MREPRIHEAVMVDQVISNLLVNKKGSYVDCTFGLGGHALTQQPVAAHKLIINFIEEITC